MRFLLDVCSSSRSVRSFLIERGHDVVTAVSLNPSASDAELLALAEGEGRIVVTEDKDFGELAVVLGLPHRGIIRLVGLTVEEQVTAMREILEEHARSL